MPLRIAVTLFGLIAMVEPTECDLYFARLPEVPLTAIYMSWAIKKPQGNEIGGSNVR